MSAPALVQSSALQMDSGPYPSTATFTLSGCTAGNMVALLVCSTDASWRPFATITGVGGTWQKIAQGPATPASTRYMSSAIYIMPNVSAGTVSASWVQDGNESGMYGVLAEFSVPNQTYSVDAATTASEGYGVGNVGGVTLPRPYPTLVGGGLSAQTPELALTAYGWDDDGTSNVGLAIAPPWITLASEQDTSTFSGFIGGYQILTTQQKLTSQLSTPTTFSDQPGWSGCMAAIKWAPATVAPVVATATVTKGGFGATVSHAFTDPVPQHFRVRL